MGNFGPSHSTETHVSKSLESLGHRVTCIQELKIGRLDLNQAMGHDLFLWTRTWPGFVRLSDIEALRAAGMPTVSYHLDLYFGIPERESSVATDPFFRTDYVFSTDGDPESAEKFRQLDINHHWLTAAVFKPEAVKGTYRPELAYDVAFVGSYTYHHGWPYRHQLLDWLRDTYGERFKMFAAYGPKIRYPLLNDVCASVKVMVGDAYCPNFSHKNYWSDRLYEATGRGAFLIYPFIAGIDSQFEPQKEVVYYTYGDFKQLKELIDFYVKYDDIRRIIQERSQKRARREHTYGHRIKEMFDVIRADSQTIPA